MQCHQLDFNKGLHIKNATSPRLKDYKEPSERTIDQIEGKGKWFLPSLVNIMSD